MKYHVTMTNSDSAAETRANRCAILAGGKKAVKNTGI